MRGSRIGGSLADQVRPPGTDGLRASQCRDARITRCERRGREPRLRLTLDCPRPHAPALVTVADLRSIVRRSAVRGRGSPRSTRAGALESGETSQVQGGTSHVHGWLPWRELRVRARGGMSAPVATPSIPRLHLRPRSVPDAERRCLGQLPSATTALLESARDSHTLRSCGVDSALAIASPGPGNCRSGSAPGSRSPRRPGSRSAGGR